MDIREIMGINISQGKPDITPYKNKKKALDELQKFIKHKSIVNIGDEVERNSYGLNKYNGPNKERNDVAIITHIYPEPQMDGDSYYDAVITVTHGENTFTSWKIDTRYYKKVEEAKNVISWRRKKESD